MLESGVVVDVGPARGLVLVVEAEDLGHLGHLGGGPFDGRGIQTGAGGNVADLGLGWMDVVATVDPLLQDQIGGGSADLVPFGLFPGRQGNGLIELAVGQHPLDPYGGVGGKAQTPLGIEQFRGTDEAEAALLNELVFADAGHAQPMAVLASHYGVHQPHVAGDEAILGGPVVGHQPPQIALVGYGQIEFGMMHGQVGPFLTGDVPAVLGFKGRLEVVQFRSLLDGPGQLQLFLGGDALVSLGDGAEGLPRLALLLAAVACGGGGGSAGGSGRLGGSGDGRRRELGR